MQQTAEVVDKLTSIETLLKGLQIETRQVWGEQDICDFLQLGKSTVSRKIVSHPHFPKSIVDSTAGLRGTKRWWKEEVIDFLREHRNLK